MTIRPTQLRKSLFSYLDRCLETGEVLDIERSGRILKLSAERKRTPIAELQGHPGSLKNPETLDEFSPSEWSGE